MTLKKILKGGALRPRKEGNQDKDAIKKKSMAVIYSGNYCSICNGWMYTGNNT